MDKLKIIGWGIFIVLLILIIIFVPFSKESVVKCKKDSDCTMIRAGCCKNYAAVSLKYAWAAKVKALVTSFGCGKVLCAMSKEVAFTGVVCKDNQCSIKYER